MGRASKKLSNGGNDARLAGSIFPSNELAKLGMAPLTLALSVKLAAYQLEGNALSVVECQRLGYVSPCLAKGCGRADADANRRLRGKRRSMRVGIGAPSVCQTGWVWSPGAKAAA